MLNKQEFVSMLAEDASITKKAALEATDMVINGIKKAFVEHGGVQFVNFGTFDIAEKGGRPGNDLNTGKQVWIKKYLAPVFRPGKELKDIMK